MALSKYKLGELIELIDCTNSDLAYDLSDVRGVNNLKKMMPTKADMNGRDISKFQIVKPGEFVFNHRTSRNGSKFSIAINDESKPIICTEDYVVFKIKPECEAILIKEWLYMFFNRSEFDRYVITNSWGSSTEFFNWEDICDIDLELPSFEVQKKYVDVYKTMVSNQACYEKGLDDLRKVCEGYIEELRKNSIRIPLSKFSYLSDLRNENEKCKNVKGLTVYKQFIDTKADMTNVSLHNYKIVEIDDIAYVPTTNRNGDKIACGIANEQCIVSSTYEVLKVDKTKCLSHYLFLWFIRSEMDRYARYNSWGSARETIEWEDLGSYKIPLPSLDIQQSIVNIYESYWKRKEINEELKKEIKKICPTLIKGSLLETG